jgi:O-antigen/teichoic acid export membrane protein
MLNKLKSTIKHSAIYSIGGIASKLIGIVLLPLYTKHITVAEYGVLGILEVTIMILTQVLILGQSNAYLRFYDLDENINRKKSLLFTLFSFLFLVAIFINLLGQSIAPYLAKFFYNPTEFEIYFRLCFVIVGMRILNNLILSVLRAKERSGMYVTGNIIKIALTLGFNIYFVAFARIGVRGILYSYLIGDGVLFLLLLPITIREMIPKFDSHILKTAFIFGFPLIFTSLAGMLLNMGDRYILKFLVDYREVGLYDLGCKIAGILNVFFIQSFSLAFLPIAYKMYGEEGDKRYYSKILTYFVFVLCWAGLVITLFGKEIVELLALNPDYWAAYKVVPYSPCLHLQRS